MRSALVCFAAGGVGAIINSIAAWAFGEFGLARLLHVAIAPALTPAWLYPRIVWGGLWALLFLLPLLNSKPIAKGLVISIFPTLAQLLWVFPQTTSQGYLGLELGLLTPVVVALLNAVWGIFTALTIRWAK